MHDEVSWQVLRQIVRDWAGTEAELAEVKALHGGFVNTTIALTLKDGGRAVLKITPHRVDRAHADEKMQLELLRGLGVPCPTVFDCRIGTLDNPNSYLLMEFIDGVELGSAKSRCDGPSFAALQSELAQAVLRLHGQTADQYGKVSAQLPGTFDNWPACFHSLYDPIWKEVEKSSQLPVKCRKHITRIHHRLDRLLAHPDQPRLVHGDLWSTNILVRTNPSGGCSLGALLDPNCRYAHAELELAYLELFHTVTPAFLKEYQHAHKLPPEYHQVRKPIYQLYCLINHFKQFGQEYLKPLLTAVERAEGLA